MAGKKADRTIKKIVADYAECGNYSAVARKYHVSANTVKKYVRNDPGFAEKCKQKKDENSAAVLRHMESKVPKVCDFIDHALAALDDEEKLKNTGVQQIATALGIVIDKFTATGAEVEKLKAQAASLRGEDAHAAEAGDDPITANLKETFGKQGG